MRIAVVLLALLIPAHALAEVDGREKGTAGIGIIIGEPTGIAAKLYVKDDQAFAGGFGFALFGGGFHMHVDYVFHPFVLQKRESFVLAAYLGPGVRFIQYREGRGDSGFVALGLRGVGGLLFDFDNPLDAFIEVAGVVEYGFADNEGGGFALNASAGVRYYF
jgi:hypothetical protein